MIDKTTQNKNFIVLTIIVLSALVFYLPSWLSLFHIWSQMDKSYSHGFLTLLIAIYLLVCDKDKINNTLPKPNKAFLLILCACSITWFLSHFVKIQLGTQLLIPASIFVATFATLGHQIALRIIPALCFILLAIPVWDYSIPYLQSITSVASSAMVQALDIPVYVEGNYISIPSGTFEVAGGCSGIRYILVAVTLTLFWIETGTFSPRMKLVFLAISLFFGMLANWIRVALLIVIGHYSEMQHDLVRDHETFGWFVFAGSIIPMFIFFHRIRDRVTIPSINETEAHDAPNHALRKPMFGPTLLAVLAIATGPLLLAIADHNSKSMTTIYESTLTPPSSSWTEQLAASDWELQFVGAAHQQSLSFWNRESGAEVSFSSAYYSQEEQGSELVGYHNRIADESVWHIQNTQKGIQLPKTVDVIAARISKKNSRSKLVFGYYKIGNTQTSNDLIAKMAQLRTIIRPNLAKGFLAFAIECQEDCTDESKTLSSFVDAFQEKNHLRPLT